MAGSNTSSSQNYLKHCGFKIIIPITIGERVAGELILTSYDIETGKPQFALLEGLDATFDNVEDGIRTILWADRMRQHTIHRLANPCVC